jgi:hypothetical protein
VQEQGHDRPESRTAAASAQSESSASGVARNVSNAPAYIGWRTTPFGPVAMTGWSASTRTKLAA